MRKTAKHPEVLCPLHLVPMICPIQVASRGGKATAKKHGSEKLSEWGKMGGRPKKSKRYKK